MAISLPGRRVVNAHAAEFLTYDLEGPVQPKMSWLPISYDRRSQQGAYLMRMDPGAKTIEHTHPGMEEFLLLDGELIDSDGAFFRTGDFVSYQPGTRHNSWTETGCVLAVFEWRPPARKLGKKSPRANPVRRQSATTSHRRQRP